MSHDLGAPEGGPRTSEQLRKSDALWYAVLDRLPNGIAVLSADGTHTLWLNSALDSMLRDGTGSSQALQRAPFEYIPGLHQDEWHDAMAEARMWPSADRAAPRRLQLVHFAARNIAYWEWSVMVVESPEQAQCIVLTVNIVSERVLNERVLASAGRAADRARRRAEALRKLTELVNASLTTPELLSAITTEAAAYFDSHHAAVLLLNGDGYSLRLGYGIGLVGDVAEGDACLNLDNSLAGRAISARRTKFAVGREDMDFETVVLDNGARPAAIITSPIWQGGCDYGVVEVYFPEEGEIPENAQATLTAFADQAAVALHRADLYDQIAAQRRQLQSIVENAPVGIVFFDVHGVALTVNEDAASKYDCRAEEMVGRNYIEFLSDVPPGLFQAALEGTPFHASHHVYDSPSDGKTVCDITLRPVRDNDGQVVGVLLLSFEVTELVQARQEADQARQSAENALSQVQATQTQLVQMEKMRAIGELASGVAHDFNNALMAILGYAEMAQESLDDPKEMYENLSIIRKAAEDASTTVERLQRFAKQNVAAHGEPTDLTEVITDVVSMTKPRWKDAAQREGRVYRVETDLKPVPNVMAEPSGMREVLLNMVHNALNAMPSGGLLRLSTRRYDDQHVEIVVEDTGVGMTPEVIERIFDPFFTTRGVEGTGLGLAVSWTIIQRYGGTVEVDSAPGKGTRFMLRFPISDAAPGIVAPPAHRARPARVDGVRALVVDDEPFVASVLATILSRHGYRVVAVHSGKAALECLEQDEDDPFRLVLSDHGMPGLTGLQLTAEVKRRRPEVPVLLLTGWGENVLQTHVTDALPDAVLGKPINQTDLVEAIAAALKRAAESDRCAAG